MVVTGVGEAPRTFATGAKNPRSATDSESFGTRKLRVIFGAMK